MRLAPMAGVTNAPFRLVALECGSGRVTSEEIDARALLHDNRHTVEMARYLPVERPITMQLLGADPVELAEAARRLQDVGADGIDLNMGCPVPKIVAKGHGAALMRDPMAAARIVRAMRRAITVPLTIKVRGGWDDRSLNAVEIARIAEAEGVDGITVHPRTRSQQFTGRAPWAIIAAVVAAVRMRVTGNGDVRSREDGEAMRRATGCADVMIGRGALGAPWVFAQTPPTVAQRARIIRRHCELIEGLLPDRWALVQLKKHLVWYVDGLPGATEARRAMFQGQEHAVVQQIFWTHWEMAVLAARGVEGDLAVLGRSLLPRV